VLEVCESNVAITDLCRKANLPYGRLKKLSQNLISSGLLNTIEYDGKNTFVITEKGKLYLEEYRRFSDITESFGLEM
ncbi:uncharacterized protein METZ01_LOCUS467183, partial [marine metagenome]|jgi:predicted transcriptional regulator|tara:strand:- start:597 stop:827 length:231 start_codon:yes stop_codon:yes gene_type:complete